MPMKQHLACLLSLATLILLLFPSQQLPPHIHKLPLTLTSNYVYYADLYFGTNGQNISLLVDTGSKTLAAFCNLCKNGCVGDQEFNTDTSPTFQNVTCGEIDILLKSPILSPAIKVCKSFCRTMGAGDSLKQCKGELNYGSSSLSSFLDYLLIKDLIGFTPSDIKVNSTFGCIYDERNFDTGIWGLALSPDNELLDEIYYIDNNRGFIAASRVFTICTSGNSSVMNVGGVDTSYHIGESYQIPVNSRYNLWWNIKSEDIGEIGYQSTVLRRDGEPLGQYGAILDSGTDFIIFPGKLVNQIMDIAQSLCSNAQGCVKAAKYEIFTLVYVLPNPSEYFKGQIITFILGGKKLETPLSNYFWNLGNNKWALAVVSAEVFGFQMSILGSIWMNNFDIEFDRENERIVIHDITGCEGNARRLQTEDSDDYDLPGVRGDRMDGVGAINKIRMKHQRAISRMMNEEIQN